jgi:hypothetical protein
VLTGIVRSKIFTLSARIVIGEASTVRERTAIFVDHFTNTVAIAVLDTRVGARLVAGYVAGGTEGAGITDTLVTTISRCKVVAGAILRAGVGRTSS